MIQSIKNLLIDYGIEGDIILYRDDKHKKSGLCDYIRKHKNIGDKEVVTYSDGAFGLYLARALPQNTVHTCCNGLSPDYGDIMKMQQNLFVYEGMRRPFGYKDFVEAHPEYVEINQYKDDIVKDYYKEHFADIVEMVKDCQIDAFCEYGHSGSTLRGFVEANLVDWQFIMATIDLKVEILDNYVPRFRNHMNFIKGKLQAKFCVQVDTFELGLKIESNFPQFGNVYEATRSIAGAINWLSTNPNKTVLVYVGDSPEKEGLKFRGNSLSRVGTKELFFNYTMWKNLKKGIVPTTGELQSYYDMFSNCENSYKKYIFSNLLLTYLYYCKRFTAPNRATFIKFANNIKSICSEINNSTFEIVDAVIEKNIEKIKEAINNDELKGNDVLLQKFAYENISVKDKEKYDNVVEKNSEVRKVFMKLGSLL